jgi:predicted nucleic acid-binding Zn ribbon protein
MNSPFLLKTKFRKTPDSVKSILAAVLKKHGLETKLAKYDFVLHWAEIVGPEIAKRTKPLQIRNGVLTVAVQNSIWAQELTFNKKMIIKKLSERVGENSNTVKDIHFNVTADF